MMTGYAFIFYRLLKVSSEDKKGSDNDEYI